MLALPGPTTGFRPPGARLQRCTGARTGVRTVAVPATTQHQPGSDNGPCTASPSQTSSAEPASAADAALMLLAAKTQRSLRKLSAWLQQGRLRDLVFGTQPFAGQTLSMAALTVATLTLPSLPGNGVHDLLTNTVFLAGFWAWGIAQCLKIFTKRIKKGVWDVRAIIDSGGMPSSHSALCAGITTAIAMQHGMGSTTFALAVALSSIVMYDAAGVRRHAGKHAEVLNHVLSELLEGHPISQVQLKEVLGHTPLQVCAGAMLGIVVGYFFPYHHFVPIPTVAH